MVAFAIFANAPTKFTYLELLIGIKYSDTSANEDNSFRNYIRQPKRDFL